VTYWRPSLAVLGLVAGCGRLGFDSQPDVDAQVHTWELELEFRRALTIDPARLAPGSEDLLGFPVLVDLAEPELRTGAAGGNVQHPAGHDISFVTPDGELLAYDLERYEPSTGNFTAWVRLPIVSASTETRWYLYYGSTVLELGPDPDAVWDDSHAGIWHLTEPDGTRADASGNNNHVAERNNPIPVASSAVIGQAIELRVDQQHYLGILDANQRGLDLTGPMTISFWARAAAQLDGWRNVLSKWQDGADAPQPNNSYYVGMDTFGAGHRLKFALEDASGQTFVYGTTVLAVDTWYHVAAVYDGQAMQVFLNGTSDAAAVPRSTGARDGTAELNVGGKAANRDYGHHGALDEVRISNVARSAAWLRTEHDNQRAPDAFVTVGDEERRR
jgi:biopolymer transport protein ExbB